MLIALFIVFYYLSYLTTSFGSFLIFLFLFWFLLRNAVHYLVFPGSSWFWLRAIEFGFCKDLCSKLLSKICDLRIYLESIKTQEFSKFDYDIVSLLNRVIEISHKTQASSKWTPNQEQFYSLLTKLKSDLIQTNIVINSTNSKTMWDWLSKKKPSANIVYEDYPDCSQAKTLIEDCMQIESRLKETLTPPSIIKKTKKYLTENILGNIDYLREDLKQRFNCEQFWVGDKKKSDCMYITANPEAPTMIYCNPNAGYYEFSYYRSEWFEFYYELGINLVLWNYRGYGRSQGRPGLKNLLRDGEEIFKYLREKKGVKIVGIHGESLGGCISTYLADKFSANFLFADRTFSSLRNAAFYNFGKAAYCGFVLSCQEDTDSASHFLSAKCYKVLSADFNDSMINDMASLKSGVACSLLYPHFPKSHILDEPQIITLLSCLNRIHILNEHLNILANKGAKIVGYQVLQEDQEIFENERCKEVVLKLKNILNTLESGGCTLINTIKTQRPLKSLINWLLILDIWGSSVTLPRTTPLAAALYFLNNALNELENLKDVNQIKEETKTLQFSLNTIKAHIESRTDSVDSKSLYTSQEFKHDVDYDSAGFLLSINCGHGGPFSSYERSEYKKHLIKANFINH